MSADNMTPFKIKIFAERYPFFIDTNVKIHTGWFWKWWLERDEIYGPESR